MSASQIAPTDRAITSVCIVGGGSAGWLTAALIAARHGPDVAVTLVERRQPRHHRRGRRHLAHHAQHAAQDRHCRDRFHAGLPCFVQAGCQVRPLAHGEGDDFYYHPLVLPEGFPDLDLAPYWNAAAEQDHGAAPSFSDAVCFREFLCEQGWRPS
jgi:hypothetical protein